MPLNSRLLVRLLYHRFSSSLINFQDLVVVLPLALFQFQLGCFQFFAQTRRLWCHLLQLIVLVDSFLPELLVHLNVSFLQIGLGILFVEGDGCVTVH